MEATETAYVPYWVGYQGPKTEADTDWKAWLYNRPDRPFDANMCAKWMGYKEITSGTIGGWMTHFINFVHFVTGCGFPVSATAWGGRYAPTNDPKCTAPDETMVILEYAEGFHTQFTSHFGSDIDNETDRVHVREGLHQDPLRPLIRATRWSPARARTTSSSRTSCWRDAEPPYPGADHVKNWFDCIRNGGQPNANMDFGYKQGVAVAMGDLAWDTNSKVYFDKDKREVRV